MSATCPVIGEAKACSDSCQYKTPYGRRDQAMAVAKAMKGKARVYKCEGCHRYYVCSGVGG